MVKIPTYDDMKKVPMSDQGATGFTGGQIAVASDTGLQSFGRGTQNMATTQARALRAFLASAETLQPRLRSARCLGKYSRSGSCGHGR